MNINEAIEEAKQKQTPDSRGLSSKCYIIGDYALLYGSIPCHEIDKKIQIINQYISNGFNIAKILEYKINPEEKPNIYGLQKYQAGWTLQERAKGHVVNTYPKTLEIDSEEAIEDVYREYYSQIKEHGQRISEYANAPQEHIDKFIESYKILYQSELMIDPKTTNFFYDKEKGFTFIDINIQKPQSLNEEYLMNYINIILFGQLGTVWITEKNVQRSEFKIIRAIPIDLKPQLIQDTTTLIEKIIKAAKKANISDEAIKNSFIKLNSTFDINESSRNGLSKQEFCRLVSYNLEIVKQKNKNKNTHDNLPLSFTF